MKPFSNGWIIINSWIIINWITEIGNTFVAGFILKKLQNVVAYHKIKIAAVDIIWFYLASMESGEVCEFIFRVHKVHCSWSLLLYCLKSLWVWDNV